MAKSSVNSLWLKKKKKKKIKQEQGMMSSEKC